MTNRELIEKLQTFPEDKEVFFCGIFRIEPVRDADFETNTLYDGEKKEGIFLK